MLGAHHRSPQRNRRQASAQLEMILRPRSRGGPGVPVHEGKGTLWRWQRQAAPPEGQRSLLSCALSGYNRGVTPDSAPGRESGAFMQTSCLCVRACVCVWSGRSAVGPPHDPARFLQSGREDLRDCTSMKPQPGAAGLRRSRAAGLPSAMFRKS